MLKKLPLSWSRYIPAGLTLAFGVGLSLLTFALVWDWEDNRRDYEMHRRIDDISIGIERQLNSDLDSVLALSDYMKAFSAVERSSFARFVARPLAVHPSLQLLAWVPRVPNSERGNYEAKARTETDPSFEITERGPRGDCARPSSVPNTSRLSTSNQQPETRQHWALTSPPTQKSASRSIEGAILEK
jgi:CHASE1-domain containing sensor protein